MNYAADLGVVFLVVPDVTALAFAQILNMGETGHWEIVITSEVATCPARLFTFSQSLKRFSQDDVVTPFRLTQDS